ncbi:MAG: NAD(P)H-dependent oxidoreductase, partial [Planctomycetota bacterium]
QVAYPDVALTGMIRRFQEHLNLLLLNMYLVVSTSLNPESRSRILAERAFEELKKHNEDVHFVDLSQLSLPVCDGASCYGHPDSQSVTAAIEKAQGILLASPVYNYDVSASCKNLIEITGKAWTEKVVGFLCAAGGQGSYMALMGLANSLMLDFRSLVLPKFVYAKGDAFAGNSISDDDCEERITELVGQLVKITNAVCRDSKESA